MVTYGWTGMEIASIVLFVLFLVWSITIKGFALYRAGSLRQKGWFVALMIINSAGILELIYLLVVSKRAKQS